MAKSRDEPTLVLVKIHVVLKSICISKVRLLKQHLLSLIQHFCDLKSRCVCGVGFIGYRLVFRQISLACTWYQNKVVSVHL